MRWHILCSAPHRAVLHQTVLYSELSLKNMDTTLNRQTLYCWCHTVVTAFVGRLLSKPKTHNFEDKMAAIFSQQSQRDADQPSSSTESKLNALSTANQCWMTAFYDVSINLTCLSILPTMAVVCLPVMANQIQMTLSFLHCCTSSRRSPHHRRQDHRWPHRRCLQRWIFCRCSHYSTRNTLAFLIIL